MCTPDFLRPESFLSWVFQRFNPFIFETSCILSHAIAHISTPWVVDELKCLRAFSRPHVLHRFLLALHPPHISRRLGSAKSTISRVYVDPLWSTRHTSVSPWPHPGYTTLPASSLLSPKEITHTLAQLKYAHHDPHRFFPLPPKPNLPSEVRALTHAPSAMSSTPRLEPMSVIYRFGTHIPASCSLSTCGDECIAAISLYYGCFR